MKPYAAAPFGEGMVLQRNVPLQIWGYADPGSLVTVCIQGVQTSTQAGSDGRWECTLPALHTSVAETLVIRTDEDCCEYRDVMVGEVWIAGGQSNMEFYMRYDIDLEAAIRLCKDPLFRFYDVVKVSEPKQLEIRDYSLFGHWRKAFPEDLQYFSAVCYYFGAMLREHLQVPVGVICCSWGGTRACSWMSRNTIEKCGRAWLDDYEAGLKAIPDLEAARKAYYADPNVDTSHPFNRPFDTLLYGFELEEFLKVDFVENENNPSCVIGPWHEWRPCGLYEEMLLNVVPYRIAGAIWYQGESDIDHADLYADMMCGLIEEWRKLWGYDFPFIMTQLAPLGNTDSEIILGSCRDFPAIREKQAEVTQRLKDVYLASTSDVGHAYDIHPKKKRPVGKRLALIALEHVYGRPLVSAAPVPDSVIADHDIITIHFQNAEGGLVLSGKEVQALQLKDAVDEPIPTECWMAEVSGEDVIIRLVRENVQVSAVSFAETPYYEVNLYNMAGIPAMPFHANILIM